MKSSPVMIFNSGPDTQVAQTGAGSPGQGIDYFDALTEVAVKKFQVKHGMAAQGEDGYGIVGPKTRAKLAMVPRPVTEARSGRTCPRTGV